jgi:hypothetical protein
MAGAGQQRAFARNAQRREQIVGEPVGDLGQKIGRCGHDDDRVRAARQFDMRHVVRDAAIPHVGEYRPAGQGLHRRRRNKTARGFGHYDLHLDAVFDEQAHEFRRLVSRDAAGHAEHYPLLARFHYRFSRFRMTSARV